MNIAYLTNQYPKVSHTFIRREIQALGALGCSIDRFSIRPTPDQLSDPADIAEQQKTRVLLANGASGIAAAFSRMAARRPLAVGRAIRLGARLAQKSERGAAYYAAYLAEACLLVQWCEDAAIEHVHVHFGTNPATVAMLAAEMGGPTYSFTVHGPEEFDKPQLIHLKEKIERARFVVAISSFGRSQLYRQCSVDQWKKIHVVRCGVDGDYLAAEPRQLADRQQLVCVGRLCEQKGQLLLLDALAKVRDRGASFHMLLVGDGEMRGAVEAKIAELRLGQQITITGWADGEQVRDYLLGSRAMVLPSFGEGLPVVIMESLALARPVVSTYIAGIPELVRPGENGWLVPAGNVENLVEALLDVLRTPSETLFEMGKRGREAVLVQHSVESNAQQLLTLFQRMGR